MADTPKCALIVVCALAATCRLCGQPTITEHSVPTAASGNRPLMVSLGDAQSQSGVTRVRAVMWGPSSRSERCSVNKLLYDHHPQARGELLEIAWIACDDGLLFPQGANDNVGIDDIHGRASRKQETNRRCVWTIECNKIRTGLSHQTPEAGLPGGITNCLGQRRGGNRNTHAAFGGPGQESDRVPVIAIQCDQSSRIEGEAAQAALPFLGLFFRARIASAQPRSLFVSGPPVCRRASSSISLQPAASESAMEMACFTKAEALVVRPAATKARISATCSVGTVTVILVVAIPNTVPCLVRRLRVVLSWARAQDRVRQAGRGAQTLDRRYPLGRRNKRR